MQGRPEIATRRLAQNGSSAAAKRGLVFRESPSSNARKPRVRPMRASFPHPREIYFDYNSATIVPAAKVLVPLGQALVDPALASYQFLIVGHTDAKGGDATTRLVERRARP